VAAVPHLFALELLETRPSSAADLPQLLQRPHLARLQSMRLDADTSKLLTVDTMRLIARLPQLRTFELFVPEETDGAALVQPLTDAPTLTDLSVRWKRWRFANVALVLAIGSCAGLRRLRLQSPIFASGTFLALCSPNLRRLQHLELADWEATSGAIGAEEYADAFSTLEQLQSLTLERVYSANWLLPHLHRAPSLRLLSIRCQPDGVSSGTTDSPFPSRCCLRSLLTAAPRFEVQLLMPASHERWLALSQSAGGTRAEYVYEQQWRELQRLAVELERVTIDNWEPPSD